MNNMANIRVQINPEADLERSLPKLRRSLKVQAGCELQEETEGVYLLVVKEKVTLESLGRVGELVQSYGFHFFYPDYVAEEGERPAVPVEDFGTFYPDCNCEECREAREEWEKRMRSGDMLRRMKVIAEQRTAESPEQLKEIKRRQLETAVAEMREKTALLQRTKE